MKSPLSNPLSLRICCLILTMVFLAACALRPAAPATEPLAPTNTALPPSATPLPLTDTPRPTDTPVPPTDTPQPTDTPVPPTDTPEPTATVDLAAAMKKQKILLFEDMAYLRWIKPALDKAGFEYTDMADRIGNFKEALLNEKWDLIIAAAEGRGGVAGEFWDYIGQQLDDGASVILEIWTLDTGAGGGMQEILMNCGVEIQANWVNPADRGVYWADPSSPMASEPNEVNLEHFASFWKGDIGDLLKKTSGSTAQILASANAGNPEKDGLITVCYDGRLILQTFSTHDHRKEDVAKLWQNYIYFALKNRILAEK